MRTRVAIFIGALVVATGAVAIAQPLSPVSGRGAANARVARRDVRVLLAKLVLPTGALAVGRDPAVGGVLAAPPFASATPALVDVHRFWRVDEPPSDVLSWFQAHPPAGGTLTTTGTSSGPSYETDVLGFSFGVRHGVFVSRTLGVSVTAARGGGAAVRADAQDVWLVPRPKWERVPRGVQSIGVTIRRTDIKTGKTSASTQTVTSATTVAKIVRLVNALPAAQPGAEACPDDIGPELTLKFLSAPGAAPLSTVVADRTGCGAVGMTLHGKQAPGLSGGYEFVPAVQRLLG
jgi:hypothetical protein